MLSCAERTISIVNNPPSGHRGNEGSSLAESESQRAFRRLKPEEANETSARKPNQCNLLVTRASEREERVLTRKIDVLRLGGKIDIRQNAEVHVVCLQ